MLTANDIIKQFDLAPLPGEGGFYRETFRDPHTIDVIFPGETDIVTRSASTAIYFMVTPERFSALHRVKQFEVFHFYQGDPVDLLMIDENGGVEIRTLGPNIEQGHHLQIVVPPRVWQGLRLKAEGNQFNWSLMGTTVAPGFEFADFELADKTSLIEQFPQIRDLILKYLPED